MLQALKAIFVGAGMALAAPSAAMAAEPLSIPEGEAWTHPHTGIVVPETLGGIARSKATAFVEDGLDQSLQFDSPDDFISVYVFRKVTGDTSVWFDQARTAIEMREIFGEPRVVGMVHAFNLPGVVRQTGLTAVLVPEKESQFTSTGLVLFSVGDWYVKLRATSRTRSAIALETFLTQVLSELRLPESFEAGAQASPVITCASRLSFSRKAKDAPKDGAAALLNGMIATAPAEEPGELETEGAEPPAPVRWCFDATVGNLRRVYRPNASSDRYLIALGDNGTGIEVGPEQGAALMSGSDKSTDRFVASLVTAANTTHYVAQNRLPSPQRVFELIEKDRTVSTVLTWGKVRDIKLNANAL